MKITTLLVTVPALAGFLALSASAQPVNDRLHNQNGRIEAGERNGSLTGREADRLENRDKSIHRSEHRDRKHNHGKLTRRERRNLQHRLNNTDRAIYRDKHNGQGRHNGQERHDDQNR